SPVAGLAVAPAIPPLQQPGTAPDLGLPGPDRLTVRSARGGVLLGLEGADRLIGAGGPDRLDGGTGADALLGMGGADQLDGGSGDDDMHGGEGDDRIYCGFGP